MNGDAGIRRFRERLGLLYLVRNTLIGLAVWGLAYGAVVLALRAALDVGPLTLLWGLASFPLVAAAAAWMAWRALPSADAVRALVDGHSRSGGLVMAAGEVPVSGWRVGDPDGPLPRWKGGRTLAWCFSGPAFLLLAFLIPASFVRGSNTGALDISRDAERMAAQIKALKEEKVLDAQRADAMAAKLDDLRKDASGRDPVKTLEALDHMQDTLNKSAQKEAENAARHLEDLARAGGLSDALEKNGGKLDDAKLGEAMNLLNALMKKAAAEDALINVEIDKDLWEALKGGKKLTAEQAKKLAEALKKGKASTLKKIGKLVKARLIDPDALGKCEGACEGDLAGLAAYLADNGFDGMSKDELLGGEEGGKGGVTRGPGAAKLNFGDESSDSGVTFKEEELPPAELDKIKDSEVEGVSKATPMVNQGGPKGVTSGALSGTAAGGGSSAGQTVLPRHKAAVERYFDRTMPRPK